MHYFQFGIIINKAAVIILAHAFWDLHLLICVGDRWELSLVSLALPLLGTQHVLYLQENVPSGLFGSSVFD